jgi:hypothetical protein
MKGVLIVVGVAALVVGAAYVLNESREPEATAPAETPLAPPSTMGTLRDQLLRSTAQQNGVTPVRGVWGVIMERGYPKGVATVVALNDGTASMYISSGARVTGGKAYPPAHEAARKLCEAAADAMSETVTTKEFPQPAKGRVRFYVLTTDGVRVAEGDLFAHARDGGHDDLAPLVAAGDAVLDALKDATSKGLIR